MDWEECCSKRIVKDVSVDSEMIKSLINSSENKLISSSKLEMRLTIMEKRSYQKKLKKSSRE
ncbi:MAG: hypothetical protein KKH52_04725 [Nanoarchaeota archaeon]|nr:hypothetical protein [Nanoarchaeota archaeon]MBU1622268.1 hypothetical protein [Nanoarchaeota archaeon]MBU1974670.1 hypothetical protein [Nanoarchaeota archaeon]